MGNISEKERFTSIKLSNNYTLYIGDIFLAVDENDLGMTKGEKNYNKNNIFS